MRKRIKTSMARVFIANRDPFAIGGGTLFANHSIVHDHLYVVYCKSKSHACPLAMYDERDDTWTLHSEPTTSKVILRHQQTVKEALRQFPRSRLRSVPYMKDLRDLIAQGGGSLDDADPVPTPSVVRRVSMSHVALAEVPSCVAYRRPFHVRRGHIHAETRTDPRMVYVVKYSPHDGAERLLAAFDYENLEWHILTGEFEPPVDEYLEMIARAAERTEVMVLNADDTQLDRVTQTHPSSKED